MNAANHEGVELSLSKLPCLPLDKAQKYLIYILVFYTLMLMATLICIAYQNHHTGLTARLTNQRNQTILSEMNTLRNQLQKMDFNQNPGNIKAALTNLASQLHEVEKTLSGTAKQPDVEKINQHLTALQSSFSDLENTLASQFNQKKYLDIKALPFHVSYLDLISGQPFVSVNYDNHVTPLGIGDKLNGWTLASADYESQAVEFTNGQGQYVKVSLTS